MSSSTDPTTKWKARKIEERKEEGKRIKDEKLVKEKQSSTSSLGGNCFEQCSIGAQVLRNQRR
jgi:hypothetical protein